jgi:hypothetical protein
VNLNNTFREPQLKKKSVLVTSFLSLGAAGAFAQATPAPAAPEPMVPLTANINLTTKYKFRGQDQGGVTLRRSTGARVPTGSRPLSRGFDWSATALRRQLELEHWFHEPGYRDGLLRWLQGRDHQGLRLRRRHPAVLLPAEGQVGQLRPPSCTRLSWTFVTLKYSHTISNDYFGIGKAQSLLGASPKPKGQNTGYIELNANFPLMDKLTLNGHIGYTNLAKDLNNATIDGGEGGTLSVGAKDYTDYKIGVTYDMSASPAPHLGRHRLRRCQQEGLLRRHQQGPGHPDPQQGPVIDAVPQRRHGADSFNIGKGVRP